MTGVINLPHLIPELLRFKEASLKDCDEFRVSMHDKDLCPNLELQLRKVLDGFLKYSALAYDFQGFQDQGTDVLLRYFIDSTAENQCRFIAFQVKSHNDLLTDRFFIKNLRSQYVQAVAEYGDQLDHYYILICTGYAKKERRKLRWIKKAFSTLTNATVIDPAYVLNFLRMSRARINITVESLLREEDVVFEQAKKLVEDDAPPRAALVVALCTRALRNPCDAISLADIEEDNFLTSTYSYLPDLDQYDYWTLTEQVAEQLPLDDHDLPSDEVELVNTYRSIRERLAEEVEELVDDMLIREGVDLYRLDVSEYQPITALLLDAKVRYGYDGPQLTEYVFSSLRILERYGIEYPDAFERN